MISNEGLWLFMPERNKAGWGLSCAVSVLRWAGAPPEQRRPKNGATDDGSALQASDRAPVEPRR
jgi:hypothetical protein